MTHYCPIRKTTVSTLPEERVRVNILNDLIERLGFPASGITVEKELSQMPHLQTTTSPLPQRRADIVCFAKGIHPTYDLFPLLLIECKAVKLTDKMVNQVMGYNYYLKSYFIALANDQEIRMGWFDASAGVYRFILHLPTFKELLASIQPRNGETQNSEFRIQNSEEETIGGYVPPSKF